MQASTEPKLFVGGLPPGTSEEEIKQIFEPYGEVEEVFLMRGGSRSGMACCFVRYAAPEEAAAAIQAVHGKLVPTGATDPLVVRYADTPGSGRGRKERGGGGSAGQQAAAAQAAAMMGGLGLGGYAPGLPMPFGAFPRGSVQEQYAAAAAAYGLPIGMGVFQGPPGFNPYGAPAPIFAPMGAMGGLQGMAGLYAPGLLAANPQLLAVGAAPAGPGTGLGLQLSSQQQQAAQQMHAQQHLQIQMQAQQQHLRALQQHAVGGGAAVPGPRGPTSPLRAAAPAVCGRGSSSAGGGSGTGTTSPSAAAVGASPLGAAEAAAAAAACSTQALQAHVGQQRGAAAASPGAATLPSQATSWAPYTSPDGRTYYYNSQTGVSTWEKPT